ncbi:nuclear transport factor 2 family protein [[Eubacterium] hominis]|uniref:nuclear transport factor 2 family protein n=1 Tax=[Eubacterium] hominis TaxID=2764325 RepID=UPI003A4E4033
MRKRDEIKAVFEEFITALELYDPKRILSLVTDDVTSDFSTIGSYQNAKDLIQALAWQGPKMNVSRQRIMNFVCHTQGDIAQQSAYVMVLTGIDDGNYLYSFEYGGKYVLTYQNSEDGWKISAIKYDLDWEKGNTAFAKGWKLLDYKLYAGHRAMICSEFDSPWAAIPENDEELSDEEQIIETMFRYSFGLDNNDFHLHHSSYTDDVIFYAGKNIMESGARNLINNFKNTAHKEHALEHAIKIVDIQINGDEAILYGYRVEPHRLGSKNLNRDTMHQSFYSAKYKNLFRKIDGKWKMYELHYQPGVFFEIDEEKKHFVDNI